MYTYSGKPIPVMLKYIVSAKNSQSKKNINGHVYAVRSSCSSKNGRRWRFDIPWTIALLRKTTVAMKTYA